MVNRLYSRAAVIAIETVVRLVWSFSEAVYRFKVSNNQGILARRRVTSKSSNEAWNAVVVLCFCVLNSGFVAFRNKKSCARLTVYVAYNGISQGVNT